MCTGPISPQSEMRRAVLVSTPKYSGTLSRRSSPVEVAMNDTFPHDTSGCAASTHTVRGCSGSVVGPSGSHYIIGPLQKASGPRKKEKTAMSHFWDTHHTSKHSQRASRSPFSTSVYEQFGPEPGSWWIQQRGALRRSQHDTRRSSAALFGQ